MQEFFRITDLVMTPERKQRTYTDKQGKSRKQNARPATTGLLPIGKSTLWRMVKDGKFPKPIKLSSNITAWKKSDVLAWLEQQKENA